MTDVEEYNQQKAGKTGKQHNVLPVWGNEQSMNLNPLILANIQGSSYFKVHLFKLKTYHEVVDEIYYQVKHLEPWERGSRKTAGQTGMCGGPPADLFDWYAEYLYDEEEVDPRAGGGGPTTIGALVRQMMIKLDWFSTLFPRIPVPIQKQIEQKLAEHNRQNAPSIPPPQNNFNQREAGRGDNFRNDAAGGRGDNFRNDAGGGRGDNFRNDAGGGRGDNFRNDAGGGRGDNFRNDAGGRGSQGPALSGGNHYNPGRMDPDRREHDDRDRKDYAEDVNR
ncbi:PRP38 pre-mRNA processing factor 38 domain containing B [Operophtera brumata]|uniref:Pre-mRNA-splicing factor 38 n=1 Tax=Operophtera brumata TaxID=104452 RepID=A0A0L7LKK1_OPEBR|nr:PRP38 pre-mRNA processing factor 38 domain containing B [Operophtera brumata]